MTQSLKAPFLTLQTLKFFNEILLRVTILTLFFFYPSNLVRSTITPPYSLVSSSAPRKARLECCVVYPKGVPKGDHWGGEQVPGGVRVYQTPNRREVKDFARSGQEDKGKESNCLEPKCRKKICGRSQCKKDVSPRSLSPHSPPSLRPISPVPPPSPQGDGPD